ncbi:MAG: tRNA 2-thiouridine(34) synthase MnmA [Parcubacteria group bacterium]|nr:tRNA 2-thiouridine(34) synthase MnmA [Parcubacteria group bacterium]
MPQFLTGSTSNGMKKKVFVAMSGGVDSSVTAALLLKRGFDVVGVYMKCWSENNPCAISDEADAHRVATRLKIPFYTFDFEKEYAKKVVGYMVKGYQGGITPNPDVMCNREIKFGLFLKTALRWGADYIATGHYVKKNQNLKSKIQNLCIAKDLNKDQSYFLWTLTQGQLKHCLFPVGNYTKPEVRALAKKFGLSTAAKKDSQGICFLGQVKVDDFLEKRLSDIKPGPICRLDGVVIGEHRGAELYTMGQRHGLGIGGDGPYFVVKKDIKKNIVYVGKEDDLQHFKKELVAKKVHWISGVPTSGSRRILCRTRYRQPLVRATITPRGSGSVYVVFDKPHRSVTPGQSVVFYKGKKMLGGGIIC